MAEMASNSVGENKIEKTSINDDFENYLNRQAMKTTFNGIEVETFAWYKKVLSLL